MTTTPPAVQASASEFPDSTSVGITLSTCHGPLWSALRGNSVSRSGLADQTKDGK